MLIDATKRFANRTAKFLVEGSRKGQLTKQDVANRLTLFTDEHTKKIGEHAKQIKRTS